MNAPFRAPTPEQIRTRRATARLTQAHAAALISGSKRTWQDWEAGIARMHPGLWELFVLKTRLDADGQNAVCHGVEPEAAASISYPPRGEMAK